ncbi:MAG: DUF3656 domain-containing protein, partial [Muribaculaceae bacterium]|nr:DUF3656 domain-containing protein [Muribaculaceae bacterium]
VLPMGEAPNDLEKMKQNLITQFQKTGHSEFYTFRVVIEDDKIPFLPVSKVNEIRRELLSLLMDKRIANFKRLTQKPIGYQQFPESNLDYRGNVFNNEAKSFYNKCGCEVCEPALESSSEIKSGIELMRTKHCLRYAAGLCGLQAKKLFLLDEKGKKYPLRFDCKNCEMAILNP